MYSFVKPFPQYRWRWASMTPSESLNIPEVFFGCLRVLALNEGKNVNSKDIYRLLEQVEKDITRLSQEFDFQINPDSFVETLTVGERQQLEILRLLWLGVKVLILDEPTTGISANVWRSNGNSARQTKMQSCINPNSPT